MYCLWLFVLFRVAYLVTGSLHESSTIIDWEGDVSKNRGYTGYPLAFPLDNNDQNEAHSLSTKILDNSEYDSEYEYEKFKSESANNDIQASRKHNIQTFTDTVVKYRDSEQNDNKMLNGFVGAIPHIQNFIVSGKELYDNLQTDKTNAKISSALKVAGAGLGIVGAALLPFGGIGAVFLGAGAGLGILSAFIPPDATEDPLAPIKEELGQIDRKIDRNLVLVQRNFQIMNKNFDILNKNLEALGIVVSNISIKIDKVILKLDDIKLQLEKLHQKLNEMTMTLHNILDAVTKSLFVLLLESRTTPLNTMKHNLYTATSFFKDLIEKNDISSAESFFKYCNLVESYPREFRIYYTDDPFNLRKLIIQEGNILNDTLYEEITINFIRLFYHSSYITSACASLKNLDKTFDERNDLLVSLENNCKADFKMIENVAFDDQFGKFQPLLDIIQKEIKSDNGESSHEEFTKILFQKLKTVAENKKVFMISWSDIDAKNHKDFYPFEGFDKSVRIRQAGPKKSDTLSVVHYWVGKWNRNMILYLRGNYDIPFYWDYKVVDRVNDLIKNWRFHSNEKINCDLLFRSMKNELSDAEVAAMGCIGGINFKYSAEMRDGKFVAAYPTHNLVVYVLA